MTRMTASAMGLAIGMFVLAGGFPHDGFAQANNAGGRPATADGTASKAVSGGSATNTLGSDMRLWSFGACSKAFPYVDAPEHKECVRIVGSDEAKDARAFYFCDTSHAKDPAEAKRCRDAYVENKVRATQEGFRANAANSQAAAAAPAPVAPKRDQAEAIASLTRALLAPTPEEPAAAGAPEPAPPEPPPPPESWWSVSNIALCIGLLMLLGGLWMRYFRQGNTDEPPPRTQTRKPGRNPKTVSGTRPVLR